MKLFVCSNCLNTLYFENAVCLQCQHPLGFISDRTSLIALEFMPGNDYSAMDNHSAFYRYCANAAQGTCNWLLPSGDSAAFCPACDLNRTIPTLTNAGNQAKWKRIEIAKHRLIYSLLRLRLPFMSKQADEEKGLAFDFVADLALDQRVLTGHNHGVITLNIDEADEAQRIRHKLDLGERYRTLLGHFRHEIGHYYWERLIQNTSAISEYRRLFGNEEQDYDDALKSYYQNGPPPDWSSRFISPYASSHPWEDWSETWAHYFHLMDTMETAYNFGIGVHPVRKDQELEAQFNRDPYTLIDFHQVIKEWTPLSIAINNLSRSMGYEDFYPFVISDIVSNKLAFIHRVCCPFRFQLSDSAGG
jgi:hypothetical protein